MPLIKGMYRTGTVSANAGQQNTDRWISAGGSGLLTVASSAPTATGNSLIWSDRVGSQSTALAVRATKTASAESISWTVRRAHGWSGAGEDWPIPSLQLGISATAPAVGTGPMFMQAGGTGAENLLNLPATAVFVDATGNGVVGTALIVCSTNTGALPIGNIGIVLEFHLGATTLTGTNTWTIETQWLYID